MTKQYVLCDNIYNYRGVIMRVITGTAKGRKLDTLSGNDVRPTTDMVKEAVFSAIQFDIEGRSFLDLFAGSGQMGIEALSRGAKKAVFIENNAEAVSVIKKNIERTGFLDSSTLIRSDSFSFLATTPEKFDIAFIDPPYHEGLFEKALNSVAAVMSDHGIIICEHPNTVSLPFVVGGFKIERERKYSKIIITIYRKDSEV